MVDAVRAILVICVNDGLSIGVCAKAVALGLEISFDLAKVVDLSVEDDQACPVCVVDRLLAGCQVNDRQPPHTKRSSSLDSNSLLIRSAMSDNAAHRIELRGPLLSILVFLGNESRDTAHINSPSL